MDFAKHIAQYRFDVVEAQLEFEQAELEFATQKAKAQGRVIEKLGKDFGSNAEMRERQFAIHLPLDREFQGATNTFTAAKRKYLLARTLLENTLDARRDFENKLRLEGKFGNASV